MRRYTVTGRVQGIGFRWFVRERARALDLAGIVRNVVDGSVVVDVAGTAVQIQRLEDALACGPRGAQVDGVAVLSMDGTTLDATRNALPYPFAIER